MSAVVRSHTKNNWNSLEDDILVSMVNKGGALNWTTIASLLPGRSAKNCRERWHNHFETGVRKVRIEKLSFLIRNLEMFYLFMMFCFIFRVVGVLKRTK
jgi:hypothetical protein